MGAVSRSHREHFRELSDVASVPRAGSAALQVARNRIVWHHIIVTRNSHARCAVVVVIPASVEHPRGGWGVARCVNTRRIVEVREPLGL